MIFRHYRMWIPSLIPDAGSKIERVLDTIQPGTLVALSANRALADPMALECWGGAAEPRVRRRVPRER
jgi:hypothetical protein